MERRLSAILAADVVGYSALMERDEAWAFESVVTTRRDLFDPEIARHHGRIFKLMGDGLLAEFASIVEAVECAISLQQQLQERNAGKSADRRIDVRIGINLGEVIVEGDDRYGEGVNLAAGLEHLAEPGGICVSAKVANEVARKLPVAFESLGERRLKNVIRPVTVFRIALGPSAPVEPPAAGNGQARPRIAVLPFTNMSNDPEQEYFSEGITEDIITDLSKVSALNVVARHTVFTYKNRPLTVSGIADELGVRYVLEGSVRKAGARVRVTAQLTDNSTRAHIWADRYDRDLTDIFTIQDEITRVIVDQLKVRLLPEETRALAQRPTASVEAYGYYLRGRQFLHRRSKSYLELARRMFAKAVEIDPDYARALSGVADCDAFLRLHYGADIRIEDLLAVTDRAISLDGALAEARASRGLALSLLGRYPEAMTELDLAIALDPDLFEAHYFSARACFTQGRLEAAAAHFLRASEVKPDDCQSLLVMTGALRALGRTDEMLWAAREGVARAERELALHPGNPRPAYLGAGGLAILGEFDRAKEWAARALAIDPDDVLTQYNIACFYAMVGEYERSIDVLLAVLPRARRQSREWVRHDSDFDPLRSHPRFADVLALIDDLGEA